MKSRKIISIILVVILLLGNLSGCGRTEQDITKGGISPIPTDIIVTVVDGEKELSEKDTVLGEEADKEGSDIASVVYSAVDYELQQRGYITTGCMAVSSDETYRTAGIGYYSPEFKMFADEAYAAHGFVTVIGDNETYSPIPTECEYIAVEPLEGTFDNNAIYNLLAYTCESIGYGHFVFENKYIIYYQLDSTTVKYDTYENNKANYDLSLGSLYDFDNDMYIYDASLFDGYEMHSAQELFSEADYLALENELQALSEAQKNNGYYIEELEIVYISPESIQAYLESGEEDTFFGYSVAELEQSLGQGNSLVYTENGLELASYYADGLENYNWKSFLLKVGVGAGIILVGAIVTPITTGVSFGCALVTISSITVSASLLEGVGTLAIETAVGMLEGEDFSEAIYNASGAGLDAFANTFVITAAITSVGMASGIIKPVACFVAGTTIAVPAEERHLGIEYRPIEEIQTGDLVFSFDENTGRYGVNKVTETFINEVEVLVQVTIAGTTLLVTEEHPFYNPSYKNWVPAKNIKAGDDVLLLNGEYAEVAEVTRLLLDEPCKVYNFTVENDHTYFVGEDAVLVHNECDNIKSLRDKGVRDAWKQEKIAVMNGTSKYNWTTDELTGWIDTKKISISGYEGCHIVDVHVDEALAANPANIIFLKKDVHFNLVHKGNWQNDSQWGEVIKIMPQFEEQIRKIGGIIN